MTFKEAYESGRPFKRKEWMFFYDKKDLFVANGNILCLVNVLADDWEIKQEPKVLKCWVNFYNDGSVSNHIDKATADAWKTLNGGRIGGAIKVTKIVGEEV